MAASIAFLMNPPVSSSRKKGIKKVKNPINTIHGKGTPIDIRIDLHLFRDMSLPNLLSQFKIGRRKLNSKINT